MRKPDALRLRSHVKNDGTLCVSCVLTIVSAQQLPNVRATDEALCPFATVALDVPHEWGRDAVRLSVPLDASPVRQVRTPTVRSNGLIPLFQTPVGVEIRMPAGVDTAAVLAQRTRKEHILRQATRGLLDLCFVHVQLWDEQVNGAVPLATNTFSLGRVGHGYRHLPLYDMQLSPLVYSTLFIHTAYTHITI